MMKVQSARELGAVVRKLRQEQGLTQATLAAAAGVGREWIIHLEKGRTKLELGLVLATLKALGVGLQIEPLTQYSAGIDLKRLLDETYPTSES